MSCVTLTFGVWIQVKVTAHRLNDDNIFTAEKRKKLWNKNNDTAARVRYQVTFLEQSVLYLFVAVGNL